MENPKEIRMFMISMNDTMGNLFPAPIDTDFKDDKSETEFASRWAQCARLIKLMTSDLTGCHVDLIIGKCLDNGVHLTRGNTDDQYHLILKDLQKMSATCQTSGIANPEHAIREIVKLMDEECKKKSVHWFWDAETFVQFKPRNLPQNFQNVTIYIIGELRFLHENLLSVKSATKFWDQTPGVKTRLLACRADLDDLKKQIRPKVEWKTMSVQSFVSHEQFELKLHFKSTAFLPPPRFSLLSIVGFLHETELFRVTSSSIQCSPDSRIFHVATTSPVSKQILYSIGHHLLARPKQPVVAICQCISKNGKFVNYGIILASINEFKAIRLILVVNSEVSQKLSQQGFRLVNEVNEPIPPIPDPSYVPVAPTDGRLIKKRLAELDTFPEDVKKKKFEEMVDEYRCLKADGAFLKQSSNFLKKTKKDA